MLDYLESIAITQGFFLLVENNDSIISLCNQKHYQRYILSFKQIIIHQALITLSKFPAKPYEFALVVYY